MRPRRAVAAAFAALLLLAVWGVHATQDLSLLGAKLAEFRLHFLQVPGEPAAVVVRSGVVNVRAKAAAESRVIGRLEGGTALSEIGRRSGWVQVIVPGTGGQLGWIHSSLLTFGSVRPSPP